jgi:nucleoside-diphosphate-sugar epimerase
MAKKKTKSHSILVTGSGGFIGSNFVRGFKKKYPKSEIVGIDVRKGDDCSDIFYKGSITDDVLVERIFKKHRPAHVFHFAAIPRVAYSVQYPAKTAHVNVHGTALLLEKARDFGAKRFIFSSSSSVYGGAKKLPTKEHENLPDPRSPYAAHKFVGEIFCRQTAEFHDIDTVSLRYFNVYGPGQYGDSPYSTVVSSWLENLFFPQAKPPYLEGNGKQSRDFSYVDDVVQANIKAMEYDGRFAGEVFNVGANSRTDLLTVKKLIEKHTGEKLMLDRRPPRTGDVKHTHADVSKARKWFGYRPEFSFEEGLKRTIEWFRIRKQ